MLFASLTSSCHQSIMLACTAVASTATLFPTTYSHGCSCDRALWLFRYGQNGRCDCIGHVMKNISTRSKNQRGLVLRSASASDSPHCSNVTRDLSSPELYQQVLKDAREKFIQEISFHSSDRDVSLAKTTEADSLLLEISVIPSINPALLYIAAEDEAFTAFNREMDARSLLNERKSVYDSSLTPAWESVEGMPLAGKKISEWLSELDALAKEVEAELVSRDIGCHLVEVLDAVNVVLFQIRGFRRLPVLVDRKFSYLHSVLSSGCGSAIMLSIIYIEVCQRLGLKIVGSRIGEDFLIWPQTGNPEELFKVTSGQSLFAIVNGQCVEDGRSRASDLTSNSLSGLELATNQDIIGIALANLIRFHWKRASRLHHGLMLTEPLRNVYNACEKLYEINKSNVPLLRPQDIRLAIIASERLLILQPHNWALRRDHGMLLYYNREYRKSVQELSICMAFAPEEEAAVLEPFVEKLHLMRLELSWISLEQILQLHLGNNKKAVFYGFLIHTQKL